MKRTEETILVVDDSRVVRETISGGLKKAGYNVLTAENGSEGLELVKQSVPDLIISDIVMPEMDGMEFLKALREDPKTEAIPLIFLTAIDEMDNKIMGFQAGADDYITKPVKIEELLVRVAAKLERMKFLRERADLDGLTGLYNRRYFDEKLSEVTTYFRRYESPLSLSIMDIDHFKKVNDNYGHPVGDFVLRELAKITKKNIRDTDIAARYGGEEFAIIMPQTAKFNAYVAMERLRSTIESHKFVEPEKKLGLSITVSIGITQFLPQHDGLIELIERADGALYKAKKNGRNRVETI